MPAAKHYGALVGGAAVAGILALVIALVFLLMSVAQDEEDQGGDGQQCTVSSDGEGGGTPIPDEYGELVNSAAKEAGLPTDVLAAQINAESQWDPQAGSPAGAQGIAQFMPETWTSYGEGGDIHNPDDAIPAMGRYMKDLKSQVSPLANGDAKKTVEYTLAAYNAGPGAVEEHGGIPPYDETQNYVEKILNGGGGTFASDCTSSGKGGEWDGDLGDGVWTIPLPDSSKTGAGSFGARNIPGMPSWANQHAGVDLATGRSSSGLGGPVVAPAKLKVLDIYEPDGCVQTRLITEGDDPAFGMGFCHLGEIDVSEDDVLERGDVLGIEGNQAENLGNSQGGGGIVTHLHFEMYPPETPETVMVVPGNDSAIDPEPILKKKGAWPE